MKPGDGIHVADRGKDGNAYFSRVLRDSTPRYVGPAVGRSVGRSSFYFLVVFELFEHTAPSQMP